MTNEEPPRPREVRCDVAGLTSTLTAAVRGKRPSERVVVDDEDARSATAPPPGEAASWTLGERDSSE
jgi:hypothetical protein